MDMIESDVLEAKRRYMKEWRKNNPDKVKAAQQRYWERRARRNGQINQELEGLSSVVKKPM